MINKTLFTILLLWTSQIMAVPHTTLYPSVIEPDLLDWGRDKAPSLPDLSEPTANRINDFHAEIRNCDMVISTSGNYHMVMMPYLHDVFLPNNLNIGTWFATTSPPISIEHLENGELSIGNISSSCLPTVAVGPKKIMDKLIQKGLVIGDPVPIIRNQGNVLLVQKGNPKNIESVWDLSRDEVRITTSNPFTEPGSFGNYSNSIFNIARGEHDEISATALYNKTFNSDIEGKWKTGKRIHHREVPQLIANDEVDVAPIFYHLAKYIKNRFPDKFDIVPLGGSIDYPQPLAGNKIGTLYIVRTKAAQSGKQRKYALKLIKGFQSDEFTDILNQHGLKRP